MTLVRKAMAPRRFHRSLTIPSLVLSLTVALLALLHPGVAQGDGGPCATGGAVHRVADNPGLVSDCTALLTARDILAGDKELNWSASTDISQWEGVTLAGWPLRVTELRLRSRGLNGEVPEELGSLPSLASLNLGSNQLIGDIPAQLGSLSSLVELYLFDNELTGGIPAELGALSNLQVLHLGGNRLTGPISYQPEGFPALTRVDLSNNRLSGHLPPWLGSLSNLMELRLCGNDFTGIIPSELGNLKDLTFLCIGRNQLTGTIPASLGNLGNLEMLHLYDSGLAGEIPPELGRLSNLKHLNLTNNDLSGPIPQSLGHLSNLERLRLNGNNLTGQIPAELGNLSKLTNLELGSNELTGSIPPELGKLEHLLNLNLRYNELSGTIPSELYGLSNLVRLILGDNQLTGGVSGQVDGLVNLGTLHLYNNHLDGPIPRELINIEKLRYLNLGRNPLGGEIPEWLSGISNLEHINLLDTGLTGDIPPEWSNLSNLRTVHLQLNGLSGPIPPWLGTLVGLEQLYLNHNQFTGTIPAELGDLRNLYTLSLGTNLLTGTIPDELALLSQLESLNLSGNRLTGGIPPEVGGLSNLWRLELSQNRLTGEIPPELGGLSNLRRLELSQNRLTGEIPSELGGLSNLMSLVLAQNQLTGEIPAELADLTKLSTLYLRENDLTGCLPLALSRLDNLYVDDHRLPFCFGQDDDPTTVSTPSALTAREGGVLVIEKTLLLANDIAPENRPLRIIGVSDAVNGTVDVRENAIEFTHDGSETNSGGFTYTVSDGVDTVTAAVTVTVSPVNDPPKAAGDTAIVAEGGTLQIRTPQLLVNDSDAEGQALNISAVGDAVNGTVRLHGTTITYVHDGSETTSGGFTYTVSDGVDTATAAVTVTVRPVNDPPTASSDTAVVDEGETLLLVQSVLLLNDSDEEGALKVSSVGHAVNGTVRLDGTTITYVHDGSETTSGGFTYTVSDGLVTADAAVTITVRPVNDPPMAVSDTAVMDEGGTLQILTRALLVNDSDAEGQALNISTVRDAVNGTVGLDGTTITFVHDGSETTSGGFTYTASDGVDTATATVTITVMPVNDPATGVGDTAVVDEGGTLQMQTRDLLVNDSDAEGDALSISAVGEALNGTVRMDGTTITYVHDGSETTSGGFAYTVSDGVDTATTTVTITVRPVNDPPTAADDTAVVDEGDTLLLDESVLLFNDADAEGMLRFLGVGNAINGAVRMDGTAVYYVHDGSETSTGAFEYTVSDGVDTATATVTITVRPVNDPPTAVGDTAVVDQGETLLVEQSLLLFNDSDPEGETLSILAVRDAANGTVWMDGTTITYVHDGSETSMGGFTYIVGDGVVTATATVTITVRLVNYPPTAVDDTAVMDEGDTLVLEESVLLSNDSDAEGPLNVSAVGNAASGTVRMDGTAITYVHDGSETSMGGFTYIVSDGVDTATATVTITVRPVNDPPSAVGDTAVVDEGETLQIQTPEILVNDSDAEGDALNISTVGEAVNGTVRMDGTTITYEHDGSETTTGGFTYIVSDGVDAATATVTITVRPVNDPPSAVGDTAVVDEGETLQIQTPEILVNDSDAEGDALNISTVGEAVNGTVRMDGTTITYEHDGSETTTGGFTYIVSDGVVTATATVTITVRPVNDPPSAVGDTAVVDEGETLQIQTPEILVNDSDAEGDALNISTVGEAVNGTVRMDGTMITYVHDGSETTTGGFTYIVSDGEDTATTMVAITVRPVNDMPSAVGDTAVVDEGGTLLLQAPELLVNDSDAEGDALNISAVHDAVNGTVRMDGTTITYEHDGSETSMGGFVYTVGDGVDAATAAVTITVRPVNDPPSAVGDTAVVDEGGSLLLQAPEILVNDSDAEGDALIISAVGEAVNGTVRMDGTTITYVHDGSETTSGGFAYTVSDGVDTATTMVAITVRPVNDLPVVPLLLLALGVGLVTAAIVAVVIAVRKGRRASQET